MSRVFGNNDVCVLVYVARYSKPSLLIANDNERQVYVLFVALQRQRSCLGMSEQENNIHTR